jgi:hypothetical protein
LAGFPLSSQVEHTPVTHPVYEFLQRGQARGFLKENSLAVLPLQRSQVIACLQLIRQNSAELTEAENAVLKRFEWEFQITERENAVVFKSKTDATTLFFDGLFTDKEKMLYYYRDSATSVQVSLIGSLQQVFKKTPDSTESVFIALGGLRIFGTLDDVLGYYFQATNGAAIGEKSLAIEDKRLRHSLKFTELESDIDLTESHIRFQKDWFYAVLGRETQLMGAGYVYRGVISDNAPPMDALHAGVRFKNFEYRFTHGSLLGIALDSLRKTGVSSVIPDKYIALHRAAFRQDWGEIGVWESVIYSGRGVELAYVNPLAFLKSTEHSLRDRDNSTLGFDATVRPFKNFELRGHFLLDDIKFSEIGKDFWSNKAAWNIGAMTTAGSFDLITEYARVYPYTFSHYNIENSTTNDGVLFAGDLAPNSDRLLLKTNWWWVNRYPASLTASFTRRGENIFKNDTLEKNVGSDVQQTIRYERDALHAPFLDGDRSHDVFAVEASAGWEIIRGFALQGTYKIESFKNQKIDHTFRVTFRFEDF